MKRLLNWKTFFDKVPISIDEYSSKEIYNADESRFLYRSLQDKSKIYIGKISRVLVKNLESIPHRTHNEYLQERKIPVYWRNAEVILNFKKEDFNNIKNYRPISQLSYLSNLITKIITNRIISKSDFYQPVEQVYHMQTSPIEKTTKYNIPINLAHHCPTSFSTVKFWHTLKFMSNARIDSFYN